MNLSDALRDHRWTAGARRTLANGGVTMRLAMLRGWLATRNATPGHMAIVTMVMGSAWLFLEFTLRGTPATLIPDWTLLIGGGVMAVGVGLAARARMTMRGELAVVREFAVVVLLVISLFPALMLVLYGVAMTTSAGVVSLSWALWGVAVVIAIMVQLAVFAGLVLLVLASFKEGAGMLLFAALYAFIVSVVANAITDDPADAWNFALYRWTRARASLIPEWTFVFHALRAAIAPLDHVRLMSALASIVGGACAGLVLSTLLRAGRQQLMTHARLRPWLPMAAAPVPDTSPLLDERILPPLVTYALITWAVVLVWRVI